MVSSKPQSALGCLFIVQMIFLILMTGCSISNEDRRTFPSSYSLESSSLESRRWQPSTRSHIKTVSYQEADPTSSNIQHAQAESIPFPADRSASFKGEAIQEGMDMLPRPESTTHSRMDPLEVRSSESLLQMIQQTVQSSPKLVRLREEFQAVWQQVPVMNRFPDPSVSANLFGHPIETAAGSQRANFSFIQQIPSLSKLSAQSQQKILEAMTLEQLWKAEALRLESAVKVRYAKLYLLGQQYRLIKANQEILEGLIDVATQRIEVEKGTRNDVYLGTLELTQLADQEIQLKREIKTIQVQLNGLMNRAAATPIAIPQKLSERDADWTLSQLMQTARELQPEIQAAHLKNQAAAWGVEIACLSRRPRWTFGLNWFVMDDNRPASPVVDIGKDAWSVNVGLTLPLYGSKYDSLQAEAYHRHRAAHAQIHELNQEYETRIADVLEQFRSAVETAELYQETILPQAKSAFEADQESYFQLQSIDFDRVLGNLRKLLQLEVGYHRALATVHITLAQLELAIGSNLYDQSRPESGEETDDQFKSKLRRKEGEDIREEGKPDTEEGSGSAGSPDQRGINSEVEPVERTSSFPGTFPESEERSQQSSKPGPDLELNLETRYEF